jgi:hypothetical protein
MKFNEFKPSSRPQLTEDQIYTQNLLMDFLESKITKEEFLKQIDESVGRDQLNEWLLENPILAGLGAAAGAASRFAPQIARGAANLGGKAVQGIKNFFGGGPKAVAGKVGGALTGPTATGASVGAMVAPNLLKNVGKVAGGAGLGAAGAMALGNDPSDDDSGMNTPAPNPYAANADPKMPKGWDKDKKKDDGPSNFGAAFAAARKKQGGPGGKFTWQGKEYQTNVKGEKYATNPVSVDKATGTGMKSTPVQTGGRQGEFGGTPKGAPTPVQTGGRQGEFGGVAKPKAAGTGMKSTTTPGSKVKTPGPSVTQNPAYKQTGMDDVDMPEPEEKKMPKAFGIGPRVDDPKGGETVKTPFGFSYKTLPKDPNEFNDRN